MWIALLVQIFKRLEGCTLFMSINFKEALKSSKPKCERLIECMPKFHTVSSDTNAYATSVDLIYTHLDLLTLLHQSS